MVPEPGESYSLYTICGICVKISVNLREIKKICGSLFSPLIARIFPQMGFWAAEPLVLTLTGFYFFRQDLQDFSVSPFTAFRGGHAPLVFVVL
jgi:hypothetical protein